jgi:putative hydrolase
VARRDFSEKLIEEINFPEELIVNRSVDVFKEYIHRKYKEDK